MSTIVNLQFFDNDIVMRANDFLERIRLVGLIRPQRHHTKNPLISRRLLLAGAKNFDSF